MDKVKWKIRFLNLPRLVIQMQFEPRDIWVGLFWRKTEIALHIYICILPIFPLHITKAIKNEDLGIVQRSG